MRIQLSLSLILLLALCSPLLGNAAGDETQVFTISGKVFDSEGNPADSTSIRVDSMASVWSSDGRIQFLGFRKVSIPFEHIL